MKFIPDVACVRKRLLLLAFAALSSSCGRADRGDRSPPSGASAGASRSSERQTLRPDGFGSIRTGMTLAEASTAVTQRFPVRQDTTQTCELLRPHAFPAGVSMMIERDTVVRVDVDAPQIATDSGVHVGDTETALRAAYHDRLRVEPHKYNGPAWHNLIFEPSGDTLHRIVFESDGKQVRSMRGGVRPAVDYVERCG
jgi:hypothetical protein